MDYPGKVITKTQVTPTQTSASGNWTLDDQAAAIKNNNWPVALVPNPISKSLRFNSADSAYLGRTPSVAGNRKTWTWSGWVKRSAITPASSNFFFFAGASGASSDTTYFGLYFSTSDALAVTGYSQVWRLTTQVFRDPSAWYHIVVAFDTTQATGSNRVKVYLNGSQITAFSSSTDPTLNTDYSVNSTVGHSISGRNPFAASTYFDGYLTEVNFIDGQALTPSSFGMTNPQTGQWIPLKYSGTYGTNGFYLNFKDATSTTTLGLDYSGNANNWTTNNFSVTAGAGNDSLTDVPTPWFAYNTTGDVGGVFRGNYATFNALQLGSSTTLNNGNLDSAATASIFNTVSGTMFASSGKWYAEVTILDVSADYSTKRVGVGIIKDTGTEQSSYLGSSTSGYAYYANATKYNNATSGSYGASYVTNDVIGIAMDLDAGTLVFYKNNTSQGTAYSGLSGAFSFAASHYGSGAKVAINFGQRPFAYTPPTGFRSLCTTNLPATAIGFGLTNQGDDYFNALLYNGSATSQNITGVGFSPDLVWIKTRSNAESHQLVDQVRGATKAIMSNETSAETTWTNGLSAFLSDGFTLPGGNNRYSDTGYTYVAWNWNAGGSNATNTSGTITSTVRANTTAGFSIVTYAGSSTAGTVGHGLGVAPKMIIIKDRTSVANWYVWHTALAANEFLLLNTTAATGTSSTIWNNSLPTSTVFGSDNWGTDNLVAYCFAAVPGYSAFGSYTGNGSTDGPFAYLGFRPRFVMVKRSDSASAVGWVIWDTVRGSSSGGNVVGYQLYPNLSAAESSTSTNIDILSNGFKMRDTYQDWNASGGTYIYACFAESPFQFSNAR